MTGVHKMWLVDPITWEDNLPILTFVVCNVIILRISLVFVPCFRNICGGVPADWSLCSDLAVTSHNFRNCLYVSEVSFTVVIQLTFSILHWHKLYRELFPATKGWKHVICKALNRPRTTSINTWIVLKVWPVLSSLSHEPLPYIAWGRAFCNISFLFNGLHQLCTIHLHEYITSGSLDAYADFPRYPKTEQV